MSKIANKKILNLIIIGLFLFPFSLFSQEIEVKKEWEKHQIKFTPTKIFNPVYPGIELGYEYRYNRFSSQISTAYLFEIVEHSYNTYNGFQIKFEEKFFFKKQPKNNVVKFYLSAEISYVYLEQNGDYLFLPAEYKQLDWEKQEQYTFSRNSDSQKQAIITNCKFGLQIKVKKIILEPNVGIGLGFHNAIYYNKLHHDDILFNNSRHFNVYSSMDKEGFKVLPSFSTTFKIGYTF